MIDPRMTEVASTATPTMLGGISAKLVPKSKMLSPKRRSASALSSKATCVWRNFPIFSPLASDSATESVWAWTIAKANSRRRLNDS